MQLQTSSSIYINYLNKPDNFLDLAYEISGMNCQGHHPNESRDTAEDVPCFLGTVLLIIDPLSEIALSVSAACALACTTCKTFCKPTTIRCHSCCMCHSFPSAHILYRPAVFFAARYLFCSSVNLISASWYRFCNVCNSSAHSNKQWKLSLLHGADSPILHLVLLGFWTSSIPSYS
jgi:hypothetical protein